MAKYCLDSNAVSDILNGVPEVMRHFKAAEENGDELFIPSIVYYEIIRGLKRTGKIQKLNAFKFFYEEAEPLYLDEGSLVTLDKAAEIYIQLHKGRLIEDNDIFIAATAIVNDCILVTANTRHFERVEGLKFVNWRT